MRMAEIDVKSANRTITYNGYEQQVLVEYYICDRETVKILSAKNGRDDLVDILVPGIRSQLRRGISKDIERGAL